MTNPQIEKRLLKAYQESLYDDFIFKEFMEKNAPKKVDYGVELCYLPEFLEGEEYKFIDERNCFHADENYLKQKQSCSTALNEVSDEYGNFIFTQKNVRLFFDKHLPLYYDLFHLWNYRAFHTFRNLFFHLVNWIEYYKLGSKAKAALQNLYPYNDDDIEDWLIDYNRLFYCNGIFWGSFFELIDEKSHLYKFKTNEFTSFFQGEEITDCIEFGEKYKLFEQEFFPREGT